MMLIMRTLNLISVQSWTYLGGQSVVRQLSMQEGKLERQEGSLSVCLSLCLSIGQSVEWWRILSGC